MNPALDQAQRLLPQDPFSAPVAPSRAASRVGADSEGLGLRPGPSRHGPSARLSPERPAAKREPEVALPPLWEFVYLTEHAPPALPVSSAAAQAWVALKKALTRNDEEGMAPARQEQALRSLSETRLSHFVRPIDWVEVSLALERTAQPVAQTGVTFVVAPPYGGHGEVVEAWAERHGARLLETPTPAQILAGGKRHGMAKALGHCPDWSAAFFGLLMGWLLCATCSKRLQAALLGRASSAVTVGLGRSCGGCGPCLINRC